MGYTVIRTCDIGLGVKDRGLRVWDNGGSKVQVMGFRIQGRGWGVRCRM
jgi:hypothetical protein